MRDRRLNTHRDRIEPCWRFWLGGHFAQLRARLARLASVDITLDGKNRWCGRGCCSCSNRSSGPRANRIPAKISNFRLFARTEITRIWFFQTVHLCSSVFKNRLADCFTPKPPKVGGELSTRIDLFVHCCPEGIVRLFSQDLVLFSRTHSSNCHWAPPLVFAEESQRTFILTTNIGLAKPPPAPQRTSAARSLADSTYSPLRIASSIAKGRIGFDPTLRY